MSNEDKVVESFDLSKITKTSKFPLICIYNNPKDYPGKYVARLWDTNIPTHTIAIADNLEEIRETKPAEMVIMGRQPQDDPIIVETWI